MLNCIVGLILTFYQVFKSDELNQTGLYNYLYFEFPYHLFNIVAYIVFMQWVQLWAILKTERKIQTSIAASNELVPEDKELLKQKDATTKQSKMQILSELAGNGRGYAFKIYGISGFLVFFLVVDSTMCALQEVYHKESEIFEDLFL